MIEGDRPAAIERVAARLDRHRRIAGPDEPDPQPSIALSRRARPPPLRVRREGRAPGRDRLEASSRRRAAGSAAGNAGRTPAADRPRRPSFDAGQAGEEAASARGTSSMTRRPGGDERRVAAELDRVAEALLGMQQQDAAAERLARPQGCANRRGRAAGPPAPFVFPPAFGELAVQQQSEGQVVMGIREVRVEGNGLSAGGNRRAMSPWPLRALPRLV